MKHEVTINLSVTVAGDDVDWKENLAGAIMNLSFHVADLEPVVSNGAIFPIGDRGDVDTGTFKFLLILYFCDSFVSNQTSSVEVPVGQGGIGYISTALYLSSMIASLFYASSAKSFSISLSTSAKSGVPT